MRYFKTIIISVFAITLIAVGVLRRNYDSSVNASNLTPEILNTINDRFGEGIDPVSLNISMEVALRGAPEKVSWQLNEPYSSELLNVYIINSEIGEWDGELKGLHSTLKSNAVFIRSLNSIILDFQLIDYLALRYFDSPDIQDWGTRISIVGWIVAHEVGHFMKGHKTAHFGRSGFLSYTGNSAASQQQELEADKYFSESIHRYDRDPFIEGFSYADEYSSILLEILSKELDIKNSSSFRWYLTKLLNTLQLKSSHPLYVHRAAQLLDNLASESDDEELKILVESIQRDLGI